MFNDLDSKEMAIRARDYMVENPNKILKLDPDQGGSSRGFSGPMSDHSKGAKQAHETPPEESLPEAGAPALPDITDKVVLSPEALKSVAPAPPQDVPAAPAPPTAPPEAAPEIVHINLTA